MLCPAGGPRPSAPAQPLAQQRVDEPHARRLADEVALVGEPVRRFVQRLPGEPVLGGEGAARGGPAVGGPGHHALLAAARARLAGATPSASPASTTFSLRLSWLQSAWWAACVRSSASSTTSDAVSGVPGRPAASRSASRELSSM